MATRVKEIGAKGKEKKGITSPSASSHATHLDNVSQHKRSTTTSPKPISSTAASAAPSYPEPKSSEAKKRMQPSVMPKRKPSLDKPPSHHLDSHPPNPAGDDRKPYLARRRSFDMSHSVSSPTSQGRPTQGNKPSLPRTTKYGLDKPQSSQTMPKSGTKGKVLRSSSSVGKSSSTTTHHQVKSLSDRTTATNKLTSNKTRKQPGTTLSSRPRINKRQERITSSTNQDSSSFGKAIVADDTEVFTKAIQEKDNVLLTDDEELDDLTSYENGSLLDSEDNFDTFEEGNDDPEEITKLESVQESKETAQIEGDPHIVEDDEENKSTTTTETLPVAADTKFADDDIPLEENSYEKILQVCDNIEEKQEKEEQMTKEIDDHQDDQELAEEVKETSENNNNVIDAPTETTHELSEVVRGTRNENVVSNDVIEETASKLREQRKNKVRALAGAFETVISLQEPK